MAVLAYQFPSLKAMRLFAILKRKPLYYKVAHRTGSHRKMTSSQGYPDIEFAFHDKMTIPGRMVRKILVIDVGLSEQEAIFLL
jgi:predicted RNA binding protein YcfA (HicA-like mRNA interferase family)